VKNILVATDFSETAGYALHWAAQLAGISNAELLLVHVYQLFEDPLIENPALQRAYNVQRHEEKAKALGKLATEARSRYPLLRIVDLLLAGPAHETLLLCASQIQADLLVLGSPIGKSTDADQLAAAILQRSRFPIAFIPVPAS
jgi:nucleotide-binding universal stress UspA family protein